MARSRSTNTWGTVRPEAGEEVVEHSGDRLPSSTIAAPRARARRGCRRPVLELELEAAHAREAADRRRVQRQHARAGDRRELRTHLREDGVERAALVVALVPGRERHEHRAEVRREGARQRVEAAEEVGADDAGRAQQDVLDLLRHLEGAVDRGAVRELEARDEVALVLVGQEAGGHRRKSSECRDAEQRRRPASTSARRGSSARTPRS